MDNCNRFGDNYNPKGRMKLSLVRQLGARLRFDDGDPPPPPSADWKAGFDVGIKDHPSLGVFKSEDLVEVPRALVKSYVGQQSLIGKDKIPLPGEKATEEDWNIVFDRLGRPKTAEEYKFTEIKTPDGFPDISEKVTGFKTMAHKLGILPKQAEGLMAWFMEGNIKEYTDLMAGKETAVKTSETALRKELGKAYDQKISQGRKIYNAYMNESGDKEFKPFLDEGLGNDPRMNRFMAWVGGKISEDGIAGKGGSFMMTPEEATSEIAKIMGAAQSDPKHPYVNRMHPEHNLYVQRMADLNALAYPEKPKE